MKRGALALLILAVLGGSVACATFHECRSPITDLDLNKRMDSALFECVSGAYTYRFKVES